MLPNDLRLRAGTCDSLGFLYLVLLDEVRSRKISETIYVTKELKSCQSVDMNVYAIQIRD